MTILPPYLKPGDIIGLVCPAGFMPEEKYQACIETLTGIGYKVTVGQTPGHQYHYFSGTDEERINDLQQMMDDKNIKAILCARGGYGTGRIIDKLNFKKFVRRPKWIIGFSDITVLHNHIFTNYNIATMHAPMAAAFNDGEWNNPYVQSMLDAISGKKANYITSGNAMDQPGKATGRLVGGNLALLTHLIGTKSDIDTRNKILFIEDIGEYIYNVDRMMYQMKRSGKLDRLKGLVIGRFSDIKDTDVPFGQSVTEVIKAIVKDYDYPVCFDFPVSHDKENYALKVGAGYKLTVKEGTVTLKETH